MRLWSFLTLVISVLIGIALTAYGAVEVSAAGSRITAEMNRDARVLTQSIAAGSANDVLTNALDRIESRLERQIIIGETLELLIADAEGRVLSRVKRSPDGAPVIDPPGMGERIDLGQSKLIDDASLTLLQPIERGEILGWVRIRTSLAGIAEAKQEIWLRTLTVTLIMIAVLSLLMSIIFRRIGNQLALAGNFASDLVHQRNLRIQAPTQLSEIHDLFSSLNKVSQALVDQHQSLLDSEARKSAILDVSLDALVTINEDGQLIDFNPAAENTFGYQRHEVVGKKMADLIVPPAYRAAHAQGMMRYKTTGHATVMRKRLEMTAMHRDGHEFPVELTIVPFELDGKKHFLGSLRDISAQKKIEAEQESMTASLRQAVAELESRQFALDQHAIVSMTDLQGNIIYANRKFCEISGYERSELIGKRHNILRTEQLHVNDAKALWTTISGGGVWHGTFTNRSKQGHLYWVGATIVPLKGADGEPQKYISIQTDLSYQHRTQEQIKINQKFLEDLVAQYRKTQDELQASRQRELEVGAMIQKTLLFGVIPQHSPALRICAYTEPSKGIDGDFYELFPYSPDVIDISIGDVMGKGIPAALIGAACKQQFNKAIAQLGLEEGHAGRPEPAELVNAVHQQVTGRLSSLDSFLTLVYARIDLQQRRISYVDAGHTRSLLIGPSGLRWLSSDNMPLGVLESENYLQQEIPLEKGDLLFLYSDGFTEARSANGEEYGAERVAEMLTSLQGAGIPAPILVQALRQDVLAFEQTPMPSDDRTCIALQFDPPDDSAIASHEMEVPWKIDALQPLRHEILQLCNVIGLPASACDSLLLAGFETATNVIRHASCPMSDASLHVRMTAYPDRVSLCFHYLGEDFPADISDPDRMPDFSGDSDGGFGLYIIRNSVDEVIYDNPANGICRIRLTRQRQALPGQQEGA